MTESAELPPHLRPDDLPDTLGAPSVLVLDRLPERVSAVRELLREHYRVRVALTGDQGLALARAASPPDLIVLGLQSPPQEAYAVCRALKADSRSCDIPVLFLSNASDAEAAHLGLALGAVDYLTWPGSSALLLARLRTQLKLKSASEQLREQGTGIAREVDRRMRELGAIEDVTILALATLAETRDTDTSNHIQRTQRYIKALAWQLSKHPRYAAQLDSHTIHLLYKSAPLHDIGKVGIPDRILLKPGRLTPEEFDVMKTHTTLGRDAIAQAEQLLGCEAAFLHIAKQIAYAHHEKWDGSGYPLGLQGEQIALPGRLMALADVYDALISRRIYKEPIGHQEAVQIIAQTSGRHFDPAVVDAFLSIQDTFDAIAQSLSDSHADLDAKRRYHAIAGM